MTAAPTQPADPSDVLGPLREQRPLPHPRDLACQTAAKDLGRFLEDLANRYSLTTAEVVYILTVINQRQLANLCLAERAPK